MADKASTAGGQAWLQKWRQGQASSSLHVPLGFPWAICDLRCWGVGCRAGILGLRHTFPSFRTHTSSGFIFKMASSTSEFTFSLPADFVGSLQVGKASCHKVGRRALLLFKSPDGSIKVAPNTCAHMTQPLVPDVDAGVFSCGMHGAKLDAATMTYTSGPKKMAGLGTKVVNGTPQPVYDVTMNADGSATVVVPEGLRKSGGCVVS